MPTVPTTISLPSGDFVTSTLNGAITAASTSFTIGAGLSLAATNGILQIDYDSALALGVDSGPEAIFYTAYNSGTGAVTGVTRSFSGTTAVAHINGATIQAGMDIGYLNNLNDLISNAVWGTWVPSYTGFSANPTGSVATYVQAGKIVLAHYESGSAGTSNNTAHTVTLPIAAKRVQTHILCFTKDNSVNLTTPGTVITRAASTTADLFKDITGAAWTSSGTSDVSFDIMYEAN